jgi:DNA repair exonuclease SbcCD ATPase subunit
MITSLSLRNFKQHERLDLPLESGLTTIQGPNAAGKTSILKAVLYALYGASAAGAKDHLWRWDKEGEGKVSLTVVLPKYGEVSITRSDKTAKVVASDSQLLASGHSAVTAFVEEALGKDHKTLRTLMYSPQGEAQALLALGAAALQKKVEDIAQVDVIDRVLALVSNDLSKIEGELVHLATQGRVEALKETIASASKHLRQVEIGAEEADRIAALLEEKKATVEKALLEAKEKEAKKRSLMRDRDRYAEEAQQCEKILKTREAALAVLPEVTEEAIQVVEEAAKALAADIKDARAQADARRAMEADLRALKEREETCRRVADKSNMAEAKLSVLMPLLEKAKEDEEACRHALVEAQTLEKQAETTARSSFCPTCQREYEGSHKEHAMAAFKEAEQRVKVALEAHTAAKSALSKLQRYAQEWGGQVRPEAQESLQEIASVLQGLQEAFASLEEPKDLKEMESRLSALSKEIHHLQSAKLDRDYQVRAKQETEQAIHKVNALLAEVEREIEALGAVPCSDTLRVAFDDVQEDLRKSRAVAGDLKAQVIRLSASLESNKEALRAAEEGVARRQELGGQFDQITALQKYLRNNRNRLSQDLWSSLLDYASWLLESVSSGRLKNLKRSSSGDFTVQEAEREVPVTELSGAQRSMTGLALRLAMTQTFYGQGLPILLDEVTADMTDDNAAAVAGMLQGLGMQVITVSHRTGDAVQGQVVAL